jgi:hypothetical protein
VVDALAQPDRQNLGEPATKIALETVPWSSSTTSDLLSALPVASMGRASISPYPFVEGAARPRGRRDLPARVEADVHHLLRRLRGPAVAASLPAALAGTEAPALATAESTETVFVPPETERATATVEAADAVSAAVTEPAPPAEPLPPAEAVTVAAPAAGDDPAVDEPFAAAAGSPSGSFVPRLLRNGPMSPPSTRPSPFKSAKME